MIIPLLLVPKWYQALLIVFFVLGLFSYGFQFELERGQFNLIAFALCFLAIYIYYFHHKFRFFAYLLFSLSIQLKVYPVFFVVMFISDWKDWRSILKRFLGLGIFNLSLLFVLGFKLFGDFLIAITANQSLQSSRYENLSIKGYSYYLSNDVFQQAISNFYASALASEVLYWFLLGLCFLSVVGYSIYHDKHRFSPYLLMVCTIAALVTPSVSNDYKLSLLIAPMTLVLCCLPNTLEPTKKVFLFLLVIVASLAYWTTQYPATVKPEFLDRNFPALMIILISITALQFLAPSNYGDKGDIWSAESNRV